MFEERRLGLIVAALVFHFLVRHPDNRAPAHVTHYRPVQPVVGLWQPPDRADATPASGDQNRRDLHDATVPLMELEW
jgi:hypothetical protein